MGERVEDRKKREIRKALKEFFYWWFEGRDAQEALAYLTEDVCFLGTAQGDITTGIAETRQYLVKNIQSITEPFRVEIKFLCEKWVGEHACVMLDVLLKNSLYAWKLRGSFLLMAEGERWKIGSMHFSEASHNQREGEYYPETVVMASVARQRQELIERFLPGGMLGGYLEEGYPLYFINSRMLQSLGYESEQEFSEDNGGLLCNCVHPEDRRRLEEILSRELLSPTGSGEYSIEQRIRKKDGTYIWVQDTGRRAFTEDGRPVVNTLSIDITERKLAQDQVWGFYERELTYFAEMSSEGGMIQGRLNVTENRLEAYTANSDVAVAHVGASYDETIERLADSVVELTAAMELRGVLNRQRVLENYENGKWEYHYDFLRRRNGGGFFWGNTRLHIQTNPENGDAIMFFYTMDTTEQKMKDQLLGRMAKLDYDVVADVDIEKDQYHLEACNPLEQNIMAPQGRFQAEVHRIAELFMDERSGELYRSSLDFEYMKEQLSANESYSFTVELKDGRGGIQTKRYKIFYIDRYAKRVCIARSDVTEVLRQEQWQREELATALAAAEQANAAKTDFLARMSHEIRTPMNAIIGMTTIAAQSIGDDEQVADCISRIGISSRFLLSLINDILDMSRIESGKMLLKKEKIPMEEFLSGVISICYAQAESKGVEFECVVDPVLDDYYMGDSMKLQQVLVNILSNAVKFTQTGGKVTFTVNQQQRLKNDDVMMRFVISDTGVGMSEEFLPHIFEAFAQESTGTTATYGGTGLGLAIARNIVDMMDGKITVRSIRGIGSEFTVDIKLGISEDALLSHRQKKQEYNFSHLKTLVVDDDVVVCESTVVLLKEMGITAQWVDSGRKAIETVKELVETGKYFDMILIDWKMPDMDGIETARRIRQIVGPDVTIIIITAFDWPSIEHEAKMAGVNMLMSKPMFKSTLVSAFSKALGAREEKEQEAQPVDYDFTGRRVLLAEDNLLNTEVATMLLEAKGFEVVKAENGLRALELFSKSPKGYYDAILMDIRMPLMDGLTATVNIRHLSNADAKTIPILAMTANAFDDDIEKSRAAGMNAHLAKPVDAQRLYQTLYDFICGKEE